MSNCDCTRNAGDNSVIYCVICEFLIIYKFNKPLTFLVFVSLIKNSEMMLRGGYNPLFIQCYDLAKIILIKLHSENKKKLDRHRNQEALHFKVLVTTVLKDASTLLIISRL